MSDIHTALAAHRAAGAWRSWRREERAPGEVAVVATVRDGDAWAVVTFAGADLADCLTQLRWRIEGRALDRQMPDRGPHRVVRVALTITEGGEDA